MSKKPIICIGAALVDESFSCLTTPIAATSNPSNYYRSPGGVAFNIASHLALLEHSVELISHFGNDLEGKWLIDSCKELGIGINHSVINDNETGRYVAILSPAGELFVGAMSGHFENEVTPEFLNTKIELLKSSSLLMIDCNLSKASIAWLLNISREYQLPCIIEPVSVPKAERLCKLDLSQVLLITPNLDEMVVITGAMVQKNIELLAKQLLNKAVQMLWVKDGKNGTYFFGKEHHHLSAPKVTVVDITGAGDAALAGWIYAWLKDKNLLECATYGHSLASLILKTKGAIDKNLSPELLETIVNNYN